MALLLLGMVMACYWPALHGALLWDDAGHVTRPDLRPLAGLVRIWTDVHATQQYYPVLHTAFWIEHRLWGDSTLGYHLLNVLLHGASCCILALLLRKLWAGPGPRVVPAGTEWLAALVFAVHPVCVESVAWISEQKNTLSLLFYLLAGWAYLDFSAVRRPRSYLLASVLFLLALGTKSVTATLPAALLVVLWWRNGALSWRRDVLPLVPWLLVATASGLFTAWVERRFIGAEGVGFELSLVQRILLAGRVIWFYAGTLAWPAGQAFFYDRWDVAASAAHWIGALAATVAVTAALWALRGRTRGPLAGWLLFIGSLFPALGFFNVYPFVFSYVADHFQYLASMSLVVTVVAAAAIGLERSRPWVKGTARALAAVLIVVLAVLSNLQSRLYASDETLFRATLARSPNSWMAHHILGFSLAMSGDHPAEAITEYREALRLNPDYPDAHIGLAIELARLPGHEPEAIGHYERALALKPQAADAQNDLGLVLSGMPGRAGEAIGHYEEALRLKPDFAEAHANLANVLAGNPARLSEALGHFDAALRLEPGSAEMHELYAEALARAPGRTSEAQVQYEEALRLRPDYAQAHAGLASILEGLPGRAPEAIDHYETALRINPGIAWAQLALALQLSSVPGREGEATLHAEEALRLKPDYAEAHNCLAIICAQDGRLSEARSHWEKALRINPDYQTARENLRRLDRMGSGHPGNP